jgi:serine/threonine-protein kinase
MTLAERVRARGPLGGVDGARILREAAWALAHAHAQGVVHRDVKPDNILLETATGRVVVVDFGIAAARAGTVGDSRGAPDALRVGTESLLPLAGTPEFMSPEQALGGAVDARSDIYALGATAFYALSARLPYTGETATEVLAKHVTEPPPSLAGLGLAVPRKLALLVDRCLAKEPEHRPATADLLAEQLGVAREQRRELPLALRAFVKRTGRIDGSGTLLYGVGLVTASTIVSAFTGGWWGFGSFIFGLTAVPFGYLVAAARRLTLMGFAHADLDPAFKSEIEQGREERAVEGLIRETPAERILRFVARGSGAVAGLSLATMIALAVLPVPGGVRGTLMTMLGIFSFAGGVSLLSMIGHLSFRNRRSDVDTEFWARVWMGRIGRAAFALGRRLMGNRTVGPAMTHRATELSLGMAAEQLYESLPKATRQALGDVPGVLQRLQKDAQTLRARYDQLLEALADAGDAAETAQYAEARAARDAIRDKLGEAVGALETIRLNLLRLHAGSASIEGLTTHLDLAAEISAGVERLAVGQGEVERALLTPR